MLQSPAPGSDTVHTTAGCVGVFDSGVGGLTVLAALRRQLPRARLLYTADTAYAPYGERDAAYVVARSKYLTQFLLAQGAQAIVVACNTATALAIAELRQLWPHIPFVGIEPAIKPALLSSQGRPVGVLATQGTLSSAKFQSLARSLSAHGTLLLQPCPGLAEAIETRGPQASETLALVERFCAPLRDAACDTVVLGCTHYPLVDAAIRTALGPAAAQARLLDPATPVAAQTQRVLQTLRGTPRAQGCTQDQALAAWTNGHPAQLQRIAAACGLPALSIETLAVA